MLLNLLECFLPACTMFRPLKKHISHLCRRIAVERFRSMPLFYDQAGIGSSGILPSSLAGRGECAGSVGYSWIGSSGRMCGESQEVLEDSEPCPYRGRARLRAHDPLEQKLVLQDLYWRVGSEGNARRVRFPRRSDVCQRDGFF